MYYNYYMPQRPSRFKQFMGYMLVVAIVIVLGAILLNFNDLVYDLSTPLIPYMP